MLAQVTAAALASENKVLAHPASVDSLPTSANKEDHVSMGAHAARKAARVVANVRRILGIEALAACQALEFLKPLTSSRPLDAAYRALRGRIAAYDRDRLLAPELEAAAELVGSGALLAAAEAVCGTLE
jgi:histidine ammonia-lyase